jgi:hypothetical protein
LTISWPNKGTKNKKIFAVRPNKLTPKLKAGRSPHFCADSTTLITKSEDAFDPSNLSAEELERQIAEIELKSRVARSAA